MATPTCPRCHQPFGIEAFLEAVSGYSPVTNSGGSACPACHEALEFRIAAGSLELGYTYWAGSLHFEAVSTVRVPHLRLVASGQDRVAVLDDRTFPLSRSSPPAAR